MGGLDTSVRPVVHPDGSVTVLWANYHQHQVLVRHLASARGPAPTPLWQGTQDQYPYTVRVASAANGAMGAVWTVKNTTTQTWDLLAATKGARGGWSKPTVLTPGSQLAPAFTVATDPRGGFLAAWNEGTSITDSHVYAQRLGGQQGRPAEVTSGVEPVLAVDGRGRFTVVLENAHLILVSDLRAGGWTRAVSPAPDREGYAQDAALDRRGNLTIVAKDYYSTWGIHRSGGQWSAPVTLSPGAANSGRPAVSAHAVDATSVWVTPERRVAAQLLDGSPSVARMSRQMPTRTSKPRTRVAWSMRDLWSEPVRATVQRRARRPGGGYAAWRTWKRDTTSTSARARIARGQTLCFRVRARDAVDNTSRWSGQRCVTRRR